jgi:hypothetical protein
MILRASVRRHRSAPGAEPNGIRGIGRLQDRLVLLAPGGCHSNLRCFTRGSVIGGESISLRAFAVINQTAVFFTSYGRLPRPTQITACIGKETRSRNQRQVRKPGHGFLYESRRYKGLQITQKKQCHSSVQIEGTSCLSSPRACQPSDRPVSK